MKSRVLIFWFLIAIFMMPQSVLGLATEYQRNGEAYLMIGAGPKKGVYRLNNPAGEAGITFSGTNPLYDPGSSYGISVNLNRKVYTFSETIATNGFTLLPGNISVHMKAPGAKVLQGYHWDHRGNWGEGGTPMYTTSGPAGWYSWAPLITKYYVSVNSSNYGSIPNGQWYQSSDTDKYGRPGKCYRDRVEGKAHDYHLLEWYQGITGNTPSDQGSKATSYEKHIDRAILGSCIDPCGTSNTNMTLPSSPQYVSIALSSMGRTYCYTRTQTSTSDGKLTLNNANYTRTFIGFKNDSTSRWCGCSLRDTGSDYVYILGTNLIKSWIANLNFSVPSGLTINAVTVSDQWNLKGGIVYAYDSGNNMVYQFNRAEKSDGTSGTTTYFRGVALPTGIDDIKADGFGNMYYSRTSRFPANASSFSSTYASNIVWTSVSTDVNTATGYVKYGQQVTKSVYKLPLGATSPNFVNSVIIGTDVWKQYFSVPITLADGSNFSTINKNNYFARTSTADWTWIDPLPVKQAFPVPTTLPPSNQVELGVINVATPPKVYGKNPSGFLDIVGPLVYPNWTTGQIPQGLHTFRVENSPIWTSDDWNINYFGASNISNVTDDNQNGKIGYFVSTIAKTGSNLANNVSDSVLYYWEIWQIQDAYGKKLSPPVLVKCSGGIPNGSYRPEPYISHYFTSGVYEIRCSCKFKWYDYDSLAFGSTIASKSSCLQPFQFAVPVPPPSYVKPAGYMPPNSRETAQILMVGVGHDPMIGVTNTDVLCKAVASASYQNPFVTSTGLKYYIINENKNYNWKLKQESNLYNLPTITDPAYRPGTLRWADNNAYYSWSFNLDLPGNNPFPSSWPVKTTNDPTKTSITQMISVPTEPKFGQVQCYAYRTWEYDYNTYDSNGFPTGIQTMQGIASYSANVNVMVLDNTPPVIVSFNGVNLASSPASLNGYTGEDLTVASNPSELSFIVRDNNPFGNSTAALPAFPASSPHALYDKDNWNSTFYIESGSSKQYLTSVFYPEGAATASDILKNYSYPGPTAANTAFKVTRTPLSVPAGSLFSEAKYAISMSNVKYFSSQKVTPSKLDYYTKLSNGFANNSAGYDSAGAWPSAHNGYAICAQAMDASGYKTPVTYLTNIEVADNKAPVVYMEVQDMKTNVVSTVPGNINTVLSDYNYFVDGALHTNPYISIWTPNAASHYTSLENSVGGMLAPKSFLGLPIPPIQQSALPAEAVMNPKSIESGVEVLFRLKDKDNIQIASDTSDPVAWKRPATEPSFKIVGPDSGSAYYKAGSTAISVPSASPCPRTYRLIFRDPGVYKVTARVEDTARNFTGGVAHNVRKLEYSIVIVPTTMDVYVIEKDSSRK